MFVARAFLGDGLYELDPHTLDVIRVVILDLVGFNGMNVGPDGLLYGPLFFGQAIARIDVDAANPVPRSLPKGSRYPPPWPSAWMACCTRSIPPRTR